MSAFKAAYADWKLIKTRGVVQVVLEVPLHEADAAYQVMGGMPDSASEKWFGVARLDPNSQTKPQHKVAADKKLIQQAGICCADPRFQKFLDETHHDEILDFCTGAPISEEELATQFVREYCGVKSRTEILPGTPAAVKWHDLHEQFEAWKIV